MKGREVVVLGSGMHPYGLFPEKSAVEMGAEAAMNAVKDAGVRWRDIEIIAAGVIGHAGMSGLFAGHELAGVVGETGIPIVNVSNACATGNSAIRVVADAIALGRCDIGLAVGWDKFAGGFYSYRGGAEDSADMDYIRWRIVGNSNPAYWALECRKRMEKYGTTELQLAKAKAVVSKCGALNPYARYRKVFTVDEVLASPYVVEPLRLYEICATSSGGAAAVLCSMDVARKYTTRPVIVAGCCVASSLYGDPTIRIPFVSASAIPETPLLSESYMAAKMAFEEAGMGPDEMDLVELPDNSSWHYFQYLETDGFCKPGEAEKLLDAGETEIGGKLPVNPSGGPASLGEAFPCQGVAQVYEIFRQLRGESGPRQVEGAKAGFGQVYGGQGNNAAVILKRGW